VYHLKVESRRPPSWLSYADRDQHVARLRAGLGGLAGDTSLRWADASNLTLMVRYVTDRQDPRRRHQAVLDAVIVAVGNAGLIATGAMVTRVATHWTQGAIAGALTGLGLSRTQRDEFQPVVALAAVVVGAAAGAFLRREVPVFRGAYLPYTGWRLIAVEPEVSTSRFRLGLA
jgi:hypothetical protein